MENDGTQDDEPLPGASSQDQASNDIENDLENNDPTNQDHDVDVSGKRVKLCSPGDKKRKKKGSNINCDVLSDINKLLEDDQEFKEKQQKMWTEHMEMQKALMKSKEEDRKMMQKMIDMQEREMHEFFNIMKTMMSAMSHRHTDLHPHQPAPAAATHDGQNYAGVGQQYYDMSHNYVHFQDL